MFQPLPFSTELNCAVLKIANRLFPTGFDVSDDAPESLTELVGIIENTGRMVVSDANSESTIFGSVEVNCAFRAWHDWCHWKGRFPFTLEGERQAYEMQIEHLKTVGCWSAGVEALLDIEINGQAAYFEEHKEFPEDQRAFTRVELNRRGITVPVHATAYTDHLRTTGAYPKTLGAHPSDEKLNQEAAA